LRNDGNPDVDGYNETLNERKTLRITQNRQPSEIQKNTKMEIYAKWGPSLYI